MISKYQMDHLLQFMKEHPSLTKINVSKNHTYKCLWRNLSDWLNYLGSGNSEFVKSTENWIKVRNNQFFIQSHFYYIFTSYFSSGTT